MKAPRGAMVAGLVATLGLGGAPTPATAGIRDFDDGWCLEPAAAAELLDGAAHDGVWMACGVSRLYGLTELPLRRLAAGRRAASWSAALSWQMLGGGVWREDQVDLRTTFTAASSAVRGGHGSGPGASRAWCGLATRWRRPSYASVPGRDALEVAPVAGIARGGLVGAIQVVPLILRRGAEAAGPRPWLSAGWHAGAWSAAGELRRADHGVSSWRAEGVLKLGAVFSWGLVADGASGAVGVTTAWRRGRLLVRSSHLVHPVLGPTHRWDLLALPPGGS